MKTIAILLFSFLFSFMADAQKNLPIINIIRVGKLNANSKISEDKSVRTGDRVAIQLDTKSYDSLVKRLDKLNLCINGEPIEHIKLFACSNDCFFFRLTADTAASSNWWKIFYSSLKYFEFDRDDVHISIGTGQEEFPIDQSCIDSDCNKLSLRVSNPSLPLLGYALFFIILACILRFSRGLLRDTGIYAKRGIRVGFKQTIGEITVDEETNAEKAVIQVKEIPYSLARIQFLFWLLIIFFAFIHIWVFRDLLTNPVGNVLALLGISGTTFYISRALDAQPNSDSRTKNQIVADFMANDQKSKGFLYDILNDGKTVSLHRLQLAMFTGFLGVYFIRFVFLHLALPDLGTNMIALMGISSATYAGIKTTEQDPTKSA